MRASRTPTCRQIQYDAPNLAFDGAKALQACIVQFVKGVRGERQTPVSEKQIVSWFRGTNPDFTRAQLSQVCADQRVRIVRRSLSSARRHNGAYRYEAA